MEIEEVMVVGAGQMGNGIAQVSAQTGWETVLMILAWNWRKKAWPTLKIICNAMYLKAEKLRKK